MDELVVGKIEFSHDEHRHCWHDTGRLLTSDPPQVKAICCFCGSEQYHTLWCPQTLHNGHAPFAPGKAVA
jgi:hypothetical protein